MKSKNKENEVYTYGNGAKVAFEGEQFVQTQWNLLTESFFLLMETLLTCEDLSEYSWENGIKTKCAVSISFEDSS